MAAEQMDKLLTQQQVVEWTGMSPAWFEMSRFKGTGISYVRMGRAIRYRTSDVQKWINEHIVGTGI
jgi:predicted DNA-binding transcriptional regulator AlpA